MSQFIKFYFTSSMLNMFRTLIHPSSGACDFSIISPHRSCVLVSMCVGVSVWLGWGGIRVAGFSLVLWNYPRIKGRESQCEAIWNKDKLLDLFSYVARTSNSTDYRTFSLIRNNVLKGRLQPATRIPLQPNHTETPTNIETRTHNQCGDTIEKSQAPDDGCINVRNMLSTAVK